MIFEILLPDQLKAELTLCREELSTLVGTAVNTLAYPSVITTRPYETARAKIYDIALSSTPGLNVWRSDRSQLRPDVCSPAAGLTFSCR